MTGHRCYATQFCLYFETLLAGGRLPRCTKHRQGIFCILRSVSTGRKWTFFSSLYQYIDRSLKYYEKISCRSWFWLKFSDDESGCLDEVKEPGSMRHQNTHIQVVIFLSLLEVKLTFDPSWPPVSAPCYICDRHSEGRCEGEGKRWV